MPKACIVPNCRKSFKNDNGKCSTFQVPQNEEWRRKWEEAIPGIRELKPCQYVCERHFESQYIVRKLVKRLPDGQILIDIPYKCPRLLKSAVPSVFGDYIPAHHQDTDKKSEPIDPTEVTVTKKCWRMPKPALSVKIYEDTKKKVEDQSGIQEKIVSKPMYEADQQHCVVDDMSKENELNIIGEDSRINFCIAGETQIHFTISNRDCKVALPNTWNICQSPPMQQKLLSVSQIAIKEDISVIRKGIVINEKGKITYAVHGMILKNEVQGLPQQLSDPKILPTILRDFDVLCVCKGLGDANVSIAQAGTTYKDVMNMNRSTTCFLISKKKTCNPCARLRKTLRQKDFRYKKLIGMKYVSTTSNLINEKKLTDMRLKINHERRKKNRQTRRIKVLREISIRNGINSQQLTSKKGVLISRNHKYKTPVRLKYSQHQS